MKIRIVLPGLILSVLAFAACSPPPELRDDTLLQETGLISGEPCEAPCWRGITPGETGWRDALTSIEDDAELENLQIQEDENSDSAVAEWNQRGGSACCQMYSQDGESVDVLFLRVTPDMSLGEVFDLHGEPAYVVGSPYSDDQAVINLVYPDKAMVLYAFIAGEEASLSESSEIIGLLYMKPEDMELLIQTSNLHAWEGYGTYQQYGDDQYEVTPSVTLTPTATGG